MPAFSLSFNPAQVSVTFMGVVIKGYADGKFIEVERDEDSFKKKIGAAGDGARIKNLNKAGKVTITLLQTSLSNDALSAAQKLDELSGTGHGALLIKDLNGASLVAATEAWVQKPAMMDFGNEIGERKWVLDTLAIDIFVGGNT